MGVSALEPRNVTSRHNDCLTKCAVGERAVGKQARKYTLMTDQIEWLYGLRSAKLCALWTAQSAQDCTFAHFIFFVGIHTVQSQVSQCASLSGMFRALAQKMKDTRCGEEIEPAASFAPTLCISFSS